MPDEPNENQRDVNIVDLLTDLQEEIRQLKAENKDISFQLNQFRTGYFVISKSISPMDYQPLCQQIKFSLVDLIETENGYEQAQYYIRAFQECAGECSEFLENHRSKKSIKIRIDRADKESRAEVEKIRSSPSEKKARLLLTTAEKAVQGIRKRPGGSALTVTNLIPIVTALIPNMDQDKAREVIESLFAKEAAAILAAKSKGEKNAKI